MLGLWQLQSQNKVLVEVRMWTALNFRAACSQAKAKQSLRVAFAIIDLDVMLVGLTLNKIISCSP